MTAVVVGASVAGVRTAQALRREGFTDDIVIVGAEAELPYDKPPLSKAALAGTSSLDDIRLLTAAQAEDLDITLRLGVAATHLDLPGRQVQLADGSALGYDTVVLATGTRARPSPWDPHPRVHLLRTAEDCLRLSADMENARSIIVIGAGFIGSEVAATAVGRGLSVTMVDPLPVPMGRIVGDDVGRILASVHDGYDVITHFGVGVDRIASHNGRQVTVELSDGSLVVADVAVVGIGAVPNTEWLANSGLALDNGVMCDEYCRAEGRDDVFAAGDLSRWLHLRHGEHRRVEHWTHAGEQAECVAHNIRHPDDLRAYNPVDYVWSDQYDRKIQMAGQTAHGGAVDIIGDVTDGRFAALYADRAGLLTGAVTVSWPKAMLAARRIITAGGDVLAARAALDAMTAVPASSGAG